LAAADDDDRAAARVANALFELVLLFVLFCGVDDSVELLLLLLLLWWLLFRPLAILANLFIVSDVFVSICVS